MRASGLLERPRRGFAGPPIVSHGHVSLADGMQAHLDALAGRLRAQRPNLAAVPPLDPQLDIGMTAAPSLFVEDHSGLLVAGERSRDPLYTYRSLTLAAEGDILAVYGPRNRAFETYCSDHLRLGRVMALSPAPGPAGQPLSLACVEDPAFVDLAAQVARAGGGLNVVPYMATGGAWRLAGAIADRAGVPVRVAAPPPLLAREVNDKLWFTRRAIEVLGPSAVPPSTAVYGMVGLIGHLRRLVRRHDRVAIKLTSSAASRGNLVLDGAEIGHLTPMTLHARLTATMGRIGWLEEFPVQVTAWEAPLLASPSAQVWIPPLAGGAPVVEGVFDQVLEGLAAAFAGAVPSRLPIYCKRRIASEATALAGLFQRLNYFGRCSFDSVLVGRSVAESRLHWVECNGRWGGVSIPMTLANRLTGDWSAGGFLVVSHDGPGLRVRDTADFLDRFADHLYGLGDGGGVVLLSPGRLEAGTGIDLMFLGADAAEVEARRTDLCGRLTGRRQPGGY